MDGPIIYTDYDTFLVGEDFILKIIVDKIKPSKDGIEINLVKLITKTPENIKDANEIRIRGVKI